MSNAHICYLHGIFIASILMGSTIMENALRVCYNKKTGKKGEEIARKSGVLVNEVLKFVKLTNLARCPGHMKKRARLYYEAGLDTFDKIAKQNPEATIDFLDDFTKRTGFDGSAPTLADATSSVENSKRIPRIIEF